MEASEMSSMMNWTKGIDVSHHNGVVDFAKVKENGHLLVGVKATEGNHNVDPFFDMNRHMVRTTGFELAIYYHFARTGNPVDQAVHLMDTVGPLQRNERLCLDLESALPAPWSQVMDWVETFFAKVSTRYPTMRQFIYTSARIWRMFGDPEWARAERGDVALWAPRYNGQGVQPDLPKPWVTTGWQIWQWSDGSFPLAQVPGVEGPVDNDRWHGEIADLRSWMNAPASMPGAEVVAEMFLRSLDVGQRQTLLGLLGDSQADDRLRERLAKLGSP